MSSKNKAGQLFPMWNALLLSITLVLIALALYMTHPVASQSNPNPWVNVPIYQAEQVFEIAFDWPLIAWEEWPGYPSPIKIMVKNLETGLIQDLSDVLPCPAYGGGPRELVLDGEWLVGVFSCDYPNPNELQALNLITHELIVIEAPGDLTKHQTPNEPAIYGQYIVWQEEDWFIGQSDIFLFDLQNGVAISLTQTPAPIMEMHPEIYQNWVAWQSLNMSSGDNFVMLLNLDNSQQITIPIAPMNDTHLGLNSQYVVWTDVVSNGNTDIYGYDLNNHQEITLITGPNSQGVLGLKDNLLVYFDRTDSESLNVYELASQEMHSLFAEQGTQFSYDVGIDDNAIIWMEVALQPTQTIVYMAQRLPERSFLPIFIQP